MNTKSDRKKWNFEGIQVFIIFCEMLAALAAYYLCHFSENKREAVFLATVGLFDLAILLFCRKIWPRVVLAQLCVFTVLNFMLLPLQNRDFYWNIRKNQTTTFLESAEKSPEQWIMKKGTLLALMRQTVADKPVIINSGELSACFYYFEQHFIPASLEKDFTIPVEQLELSDLMAHFEIFSFQLEDKQGIRPALYVNSASIKESEAFYILDKDESIVIISSKDLEQWKEL